MSIKQAGADPIEAVFLLRAYRTTLPRSGTAIALQTGSLRLRRRICSTFKDLPGGQILGPTFDYTQRLLDFGLPDGNQASPADITNEPPGYAFTHPFAGEIRVGMACVSIALPG